MSAVWIGLVISGLVHSTALAKETPFGSPAEGTRDGRVCAWQAKPLPVPADYQKGQPLPDPFAGEKPIAVLSSGNTGDWSDYLAPGLNALFEAYPETFRIRIFPCHRAHQLPATLIENSEWNDQHASLTPDGYGIASGRAGILFRQPKQGVEALWNHLTRYRGSFLSRTEVEAVVSANGVRREFVSRQEILFPFTLTERGDTLPRELLKYASHVMQPAALAGGGFLMVDSLDVRERPRLSWVYDQSQRRLRRLPGVEGDGVAPLAENLRTVDDTDMFNGSPIQFEWRLLGQRTLLVPYNNLGLMQPGKLDTLLTPFHLNPDQVRWEAHRVRVVEGLLSVDYRHIYGRRVFYIDEDSWSIVMAENYDQDNRLWRVSLAHLANLYDVPMTFSVADVFHDLRARRYNVKGLANTADGPGRYDLPPPADGYFTPAAFRQRLER